MLASVVSMEMAIGSVLVDSVTFTILVQSQTRVSLRYKLKQD